MTDGVWLADVCVLSSHDRSFLHTAEHLVVHEVLFFARSPLNFGHSSERVQQFVSGASALTVDVICVHSARNQINILMFAIKPRQQCGC
jgi:hypothetical protein